MCVHTPDHVSQFMCPLYIVTCVPPLQCLRFCTGPLSPLAADPSALPSPRPLPLISNSSYLFTWCQPLYAGCCTILLYFSRYCSVKNVFIIFVFVSNALFAWKYYKSITAQYYIADCSSSSWVPRLTSLDLQTNKTYKCALRTEHVHI